MYLYYTINVGEIINLILCRCFVEEKLGSKYTEVNNVDFADVYKRMDATTAVLFILSAGVDPMRVQKRDSFLVSIDQIFIIDFLLGC